MGPCQIMPHLPDACLPFTTAHLFTQYPSPTATSWYTHHPACLCSAHMFSDHTAKRLAHKSTLHFCNKGAPFRHACIHCTAQKGREPAQPNITLPQTILGCKHIAHPTMVRTGPYSNICPGPPNKFCVCKRASIKSCTRARARQPPPATPCAQRRAPDKFMRGPEKC